MLHLDAVDQPRAIDQLQRYIPQRRRGIAGPIHLHLNLFLIAGALMSLAVVPVALSIATAPEFIVPPRGNFRLVWEAAPLGIVASLFSGVSNASMIGLAAVYALQSGMSTGRAALFAGLAALGAVVLQYPIGHFSDSWGRRRMIFIVATLASAVAVIAIGLPTDGPAILVAMFVFGGFSYSSGLP